MSVRTAGLFYRHLGKDKRITQQSHTEKIKMLAVYQMIDLSEFVTN